MDLCTRLAQNDPAYDYLILSPECLALSNVLIALKDNISIKYLTLHENTLDSLLFPLLINLLTENSTLKGLVLDNNAIYLPTLLAASSSLSSLSLRYCNLNDDAIPALCSFLANTKTELMLQGNNFTPNGMATLLSVGSSKIKRKRSRV